jgi:hypothetical protein
MEDRRRTWLRVCEDRVPLASAAASKHPRLAQQWRLPQLYVPLPFQLN